MPCRMLPARMNGRQNNYSENLQRVAVNDIGNLWCGSGQSVLRSTHDNRNVRVKQLDDGIARSYGSRYQGIADTIVQLSRAHTSCVMEERGHPRAIQNCATLSSPLRTYECRKEYWMNPTVYRTIQVDGLSIFYREAGPKNAETLLLLHGLPSSSRMFEPLFTRLADRYRLIAPDYPGFGHSDWPDPKKFAYTFDHYAEVMNHFTEALGLSRYILYMQDYGGPVGFRMILAHPERVEALIVQDAVAHNEGLGANWKTRRAFWADRTANESALRTNLLSLEAARARHVGNDPNVERYDPDLWTDEFNFLSQPRQAYIQSDLFYDYRTNVENYPKWQAWMRERQPRLLVLWGKYDLSFDISEPESYRRDVPNAEVHVLDAGHFALDTAADQIAQLIGTFMTSPASHSASASH